jgi:ABC-2 type transport system ATP-binding protein
MKALRVVGVSKRFQARASAVDAVRCVSFDVDRGAVLALLGENGAGKSTVMRMCAGLLQPDSGEICFDRARSGSPVSSRGATGCLLEGSRNLYWRLTPMENLEYFGGTKGLRRTHARERAAALLERFGLAAKQDEPVQTLSRGMQQRLSVICSLIHQPRVLLLDEPTLGLDLESSSLILQIIREISAEGVAVVITSHQIGLMEAVATDVAIMRQGKITAAGSMVQMLRARESVFDIVVAAEMDRTHVQRLVAEFPGIRIAGKRITVDDQGGLLHAVLSRLRSYPLVSVNPVASRLEDVFKQAALSRK